MCMTSELRACRDLCCRNKPQSASSTSENSASGRVFLFPEPLSVTDEYRKISAFLLISDMDSTLNRDAYNVVEQLDSNTRKSSTYNLTSFLLGDIIRSKTQAMSTNRKQIGNVTACVTTSVSFHCFSMREVELLATTRCYRLSSSDHQNYAVRTT